MRTFTLLLLPVRFHLISLLFIIYHLLWGDTHMASTLNGVWEEAKMRCYQTYQGRGQQVFWKSNFFFSVEKNWICTMTRHHTESNVNILSTRNLPVDSGVRQSSHTLIILLHSLWVKSNNKTRDQFECDVSWFCFCFNFVCLRAQCGCSSIVC